MRAQVCRALEELERRNVRLTVENQNIHAVYRCPNSALPAVLSAIAILKEHKQEALALITEKVLGGTRGGQNWPSESLDAECRFGCFEARLYPFIGKRVRTPDGFGKLLQVFRHRAAVLLDKELAKVKAQQRTAYFQPVDICPPDVM